MHLEAEINSIEPIAASSVKNGNRQISYLATTALNPDPRNPRLHTREQVRSIAKSIETFGFNAPILVDANRKIVAGHGRHEAAKYLGLTQVPVIFLDHLTETQARAYMLADNKLTDRSSWNDGLVATQLKELSELVLDFEIEATGFEPPEIDFRIQSLDSPDAADQADQFDPAVGPAVTVGGDLWLLGSHRLYCGDALSPEALAAVMGSEKAAATFMDPPYNVKIDGNAAGHGRTSYREFAMAVGEMSEGEFTKFLTNALSNARSCVALGGLIYACMDWRHMQEMLAAARASDIDLVNLCVWVKPNGRLGSFYKSRHELVFVFKNGKDAHQNNIQLGRFGRNRTNVWNYSAANPFRRKDAPDAESHPTVKPLLMVSDAILDCTQRNDIVLDPFLGSGTTLLAAERTGRRCYGIEIDPIYVDTAIERWQHMSGNEAVNCQGETFSAIRSARKIVP
jgi:DNA modification methylase